MTLQRAGSSPRMRGTPTGNVRTVEMAGIIPAYAGNTFSSEKQIGLQRDHPRVCGEHFFERKAYWIAKGSSPRMRGTLSILFLSVVAVGIIPAYAGNTLRDYSNFVVSKFMSFVFHLV